MNIIENHVKEASQLFDSRDPAPFHERDLDSSFTTYLIASAEEHSTRSKPFRIQIDIDEPHAPLHEEKIVTAIQSYFTYQIELKRLGVYAHLARRCHYFWLGFFMETLGALSF